MSTREIQEHLIEIYAIEVSPEFISNVTDKVMDDVNSWQKMALDKAYPRLFGCES